MPRIRSIHFDACKSDKLQAASAEAERCYWRLLPHCDDAGRAEDDTRALRSEMFKVAEPPLPASVVDAWLQELHEIGLIVRYVVGGKRYLVVMNWHDYQKPQHPKPSVLPPPPDDAGPLMTPHDEDAETVPVVGGGEVAVGGEGVGAVGVELALVSPPATGRDPVTEVFLEWQHSTGKRRANLDGKRRRIITSALKDYPLEDVLAAVKGWKHSPHHRGENERRTVYNDLDLLLRDSKHIEEFRDLERGEAGPAPPKLPANAESVRRAVAAVEASR